MRLIVELRSAKEAFSFQAYLQGHGVPSVYDETFRVWVIEEDDIEKAQVLYETWQKNPLIEPPTVSKPEPSSHPSWKVRMTPLKIKSPFSFNNLIILLCGFLFLWMGIQTARLEQQEGVVAVEYELVPLQQELMFDYPVFLVHIQKFIQENDLKTLDDVKKLSEPKQKEFEALQNAPTWKGWTDMLVTHDFGLFEKLPKGTLFGKIRQGEYWRLFTPVLLHGSIFHILFNMLWLFVLGRQMEERIGKFRYILFTLIVGVLSNLTQYLMSGPIFIGYSGIITGMVGFIWMRQKIAPWEGYPLQRPVIIFITLFVLAMFVLEIVSMALQYFHVTEASANIANTAHIFGALIGMLLGRLKFFERRHP